jgi:hypothetical protein
VCSPNPVATQRLGKHVPAVTNTHETVEELLDAVFSMRSVSCQLFRVSSSQIFVVVALLIFSCVIHMYFDGRSIINEVTSFVSIFKSSSQDDSVPTSTEYLVSRYETRSIERFLFRITKPWVV